MPVAPPGSSQFTFLQDLLAAQLGFIATYSAYVATNHQDLVQLHLDLTFLITATNNKLDVLHADNVALLAKQEQIRVLLAAPHPW